MRYTSLFPWLFTHVFDDVVDIRHKLMRDNNCLMYTLFLSMKHNKQYFIVYLKARKYCGLSVKCLKLKCIFVLLVNFDRYCINFTQMHK